MTQTVDTKDAVSILNTTDQDGFSSNIQKVDGQTIKTAAAGIVFDAVTEAQDTDAGATTTVSHTTGSGSNRFLIVSIATWVSGGATVDSVKYNSVKLTQAISVANAASGNFKNDMWYLVAPSTGANNLEIWYASGVSEVALGITTWTGVDQGTPISDTNSDDGTDPSAAVIIDSGDLLHDGLNFYANAATVGAGQTERWNTLRAANAISSAGSTEGGSGSVTMSWTVTQIYAVLTMVEINGA